MLLVVMPAVLIVTCVLIWLDPNDQTRFSSILINNGIALYVILAFPAVGISLAHTRAMASAAQPSFAGFLTKSIVIAVGLWLVLAILYLVALFGTLNRQMWTFALLAVTTGACYGVIMGILLRRVPPPA